MFSVNVLTNLAINAVISLTVMNDFLELYPNHSETAFSSGLGI